MIKGQNIGDILQVHNRYQLVGGEDAVSCAEQELLCSYGQIVDSCLIDNDSICDPFNKIITAVNATYSRTGRQFVENFLKLKTYGCVHFHNTFPRVSPSAYDACVDADVAVVQTLHNYRNICPGALLMREGEICEKCLIGTPYNAALQHLGHQGRSFYRLDRFWEEKVC